MIPVNIFWSYLDYMLLFYIKLIAVHTVITSIGKLSQEEYKHLRLEIFLALISKKFHQLKRLIR